MRAHRSARGAPRPVDGEFAEFVTGMKELLDRVLTRFKAQRGPTGLVRSGLIPGAVR